LQLGSSQKNVVARKRGVDTISATSGMTPKRVWQPGKWRAKVPRAGIKVPADVRRDNSLNKISAGEVANRRPDGLAVFVLPRVLDATERRKS
jgi:hypothetical protein